MASDIERARRLADELRSIWPEKASEIDRLIAAVQAGEKTRAALKIRVGIRYKVEKFHGEYEPGKQPFEVIEGQDNL